MPILRFPRHAPNCRPQRQSAHESWVSCRACDASSKLTIATNRASAQQYASEFWNRREREAALISLVQEAAKEIERYKLALDVAEREIAFMSVITGTTKFPDDGIPHTLDRDSYVQGFSQPGASVCRNIKRAQSEIEKAPNPQEAAP